MNLEGHTLVRCGGLKYKMRGHADIHIKKRAMGRQRKRLEQSSYKPKNAKDCQEPPDVRKGQRRIFPRVFRGSMPLLTP